MTVLRGLLAIGSPTALIVRCVALAAAGLSFAGCGSAPPPFETAVAPGRVSADLSYQRIRGSGATSVRLYFFWAQIAPQHRPPGFDPANPDSPGYNWPYFDQQLQSAVRAGLKPIVSIVAAPTWAERSRGGARGSNTPDPGEFGQFALAAARRYDGSRAGRPRVKLWQAWNEPNSQAYLSPQADDRGRPFSPHHYRAMINQFARAVRSVKAENLVIAGSTTPWTTNKTVGPLRFMREMLCLGNELTAPPTCPERADFDIWAHHPYTLGMGGTQCARSGPQCLNHSGPTGPEAKSLRQDDAPIGELGKITAILHQAGQTGKVGSASPTIPLWVTEFGWESKPPSRNGVPLGLHARWVAEALHRMWKQGVSLVTWHPLRDYTSKGLTWQSGLYFACAGGETCDQPKPTLQAFRFPFVAYRAGPRFLVWGRAPEGDQEVTVEHRDKDTWKPIATLAADAHGVFGGGIESAALGGDLRARYGPEVSRPFRVP